MQGKTPAEINALVEQALQTRPIYAPQPSNLDSNTYQQPQQGYGMQAPDPNLMYSDPAEYQRQYDAYIDQRSAQRMQQFAMPFMQNQAELVRNAAINDPAFADVWKRYGPEVEAELEGIPLEQRTKPMYDKAAAIVRGNHWKDFAREEAEKLAASGIGFTERSTGVAGMPSVQQDALDAAWESGHPYFEDMKRNGIDRQQIRGMLAKTRTRVEDYVKNAQSGELIVTPSGIHRQF